MFEARVLVIHSSLTLTLHLIPIFLMAIYKLTFIILIMLPQYTFAFACAYNFSQEILINGCLTHTDFW